MEKWKARQTSLFESRPAAELPQVQRQKALVLLGSLLIEDRSPCNEKRMQGSRKTTGGRS